MTFLSCVREEELRNLMRLGHWPKAAPTDLIAHTQQCRACGDLLLVTRTFHAARSASLARANLNTPGLLWWRAQLRRRNEAMERINKPILSAQIFAICLNLLILLALILSQAQHGLRWASTLSTQPMQWLRQLAGNSASSNPSPETANAAQSHFFNLHALWSSAALNPNWNVFSLLPALAVLAVFGGVVVYLATEKQ